MASTTAQQQPEDDGRYRDFDAWLAEQETVPFKLLGEVWHLPPDVPANVILRVQRIEQFLAKAAMNGEKIDKLPPGLSLDDLSYESMLRQMVGDDIVDQWLAKGVGYRQLQQASGWLYQMYTGRDDDDEDEDEDGQGKQQAPAKRGSNGVRKTPKAAKKTGASTQRKSSTTGR